MDIEVIHLIWEGPMTAEEALKLRKRGDYGLYQIYGTHSVTGPDTLLYIGQANNQTFDKRLKWHKKEWLQWEPGPVSIHVGRLEDTPELRLSYEEWGDVISRAEAATTYFIGPPYNNTYIKRLAYPERPILIVNHRQRGRLPGSITNLGEIHVPDEKAFKEVEVGRVPKPATIPEDDLVRRR